MANGNNILIRFGKGTGSFANAPANFDPGPFIPPLPSDEPSFTGGSYTNTFKSDFNVGTNPQSVVAGDFNADGKLDIATANKGSNNVSILLGTGTGSFGAATNFDVGTSPYSVTVGDFNSDNKSDLAVANSGSNNVSILLGTGTGSFGTPTNFNAGTSPYSVTVGDFNSDNKSDLAVANSGSNNVSILLGNGTGSFSTSTNFGAGISPYSVAAGDFNADGKTDLATGNNGSNNVSVLLNLVANFGAANYSAIEGSTDTVVNVPVTLNATPAVDVTIPIALNPAVQQPKIQTTLFHLPLSHSVQVLTP